jgi:hypothetical protein
MNKNGGSMLQKLAKINWKFSLINEKKRRPAKSIKKNQSQMFILF